MLELTTDNAFLDNGVRVPASELKKKLKFDLQFNMQFLFFIISECLVCKKEQQVMHKLTKLRRKYVCRFKSIMHVCRPITQLKKPVTCCICLDECRDSDCNVQLRCGHVFHDKCFLKWYEKNDNCPLCRCKLANKTTVKNIK